VGSIAYLMASALRRDDALVLQELIRCHYRTPFTIIHAVYDPLCHTSQYLEDVRLVSIQEGHQEGTWDSINLCLKAAYEQGCRHAVFTHADTWFLDESLLLWWLRQLRDERFLMINTHSYRFRTLSTDAFLVNVRRVIEEGLFPRPLTEGAEVDEEMFEVLGGDYRVVSERVLDLQPRRLWMRRSRAECRALGLVGYHDAESKRAALIRYGIRASTGANVARLMTSGSLSYYNRRYRPHFTPFA